MPGQPVLLATAYPHLCFCVTTCLVSIDEITGLPAVQVLTVWSFIATSDRMKERHLTLSRLYL